MTETPDYGESAVHLETLRRLVEQHCPVVRFGGFTPSGARIGEYSFRLPSGLSAWVQAPVTPTGLPRRAGDIRGAWRFRITTVGGRPRPWNIAEQVNDVADWICAQTGR